MNEIIKNKAAGDKGTSELSDSAEIINDLRKQLKLVQIANEELQTRADHNQQVEALQQEVEELKSQLRELKAQTQTQSKDHDLQTAEPASQPEELEQAAEPPTIAGLQEQLELAQEEAHFHQNFAKYHRTRVMELEMEKMDFEERIETAGKMMAVKESHIACLESEVKKYIRLAVHGV